MRIHILGVGSIGSLIAFHIQRVIRLSNQNQPTQRVSNLNNLSQLSQSYQSLPSIPKSTSLTAHVRRTSFPISSDSIQDRQSNYPKLKVRVQANGIIETEEDIKVEYLPRSPIRQRSIDRLKQSHLAIKKDLLESEFEKNRRKWLGLAEDPESNPIAQQAIENESKELEIRKSNLKPSPNFIVSTPPPANLTSPSDSDDTIDFLIITTKSDSTLSAIRPLLYRLNRNSTILLLQNGMGVLDELIQTFFQRIEDRPQFMLGITTHGCFRRRGTWIVHAGFGNIDLAVVPGRKSLGLENGDRQDETLRKTSMNHRSPETGTRNPNPNPNQEQDQPLEPQSQEQSSLPRFLHLLKSLPLSVSLNSISEFQLKALKKLIVNACINPITSLLEVRNGRLVGNPHTREIVAGICSEAEQIFVEMAKRRIGSHLDACQGKENSDEGEEEEIDFENLNQMDLLTLAIRNRSSSPSTKNSLSTSSSSSNSNSTSRSTPTPILDPTFLSSSLISHVERIALLTSKNWSSMAQDLGVHAKPSSRGPRKEKGSGRGSTEIAYINGYLIALGKLYGIETPRNEMLLRLIRAKSERIMGRWKDEE